MKAYSVHDNEVGYCQGSAFLVGLLLLQMPEEDAFAILVRMMEEYRLREMYKPTMAELGLCIYQLECLVQVCFLSIFWLLYGKMYCDGLVKRLLSDDFVPMFKNTLLNVSFY